MARSDKAAIDTATRKTLLCASSKGNDAAGLPPGEGIYVKVMKVTITYDRQVVRVTITIKKAVCSLN